MPTLGQHRDAATWGAHLYPRDDRQMDRQRERKTNINLVQHQIRTRPAHKNCQHRLALLAWCFFNRGILFKPTHDAHASWHLDWTRVSGLRSQTSQLSAVSTQFSAHRPLWSMIFWERRLHSVEATARVHWSSFRMINGCRRLSFF